MLGRHRVLRCPPRRSRDLTSLAVVICQNGPYRTASSRPSISANRAADAAGVLRGHDRVVQLGRSCRWLRAACAYLTEDAGGERLKLAEAAVVNDGRQGRERPMTNT